MKCLKCEKDSITQDVCSNCGASLKDQVEDIIKELGKRGSKKSGIIKSLATTKDLRIVAPLLNVAMKDEDVESRVEAIKSLGELQDKDVIAPLVEILLKDRDIRIKVCAAEAIGRLKGHRGINGLIAALDDTAPEVKISVIKALGYLGTEESINNIARMLTGQDPRVERTALEVLQGMGYEVKWDGDMVTGIRLKGASKNNFIIPLIGIVLIVLAGFFIYKTMGPSKNYLSSLQHICNNTMSCGKELKILNGEIEKSNLLQTTLDQINLKSGSVEAKLRKQRNDLKSLNPPAEYKNLHKKIEEILDGYVSLSRGLVSANLFTDLYGTIKSNNKVIEDSQVKLMEIDREIKSFNKKQE